MNVILGVSICCLKEKDTSYEHKVPLAISYFFVSNSSNTFVGPQIASDDQKK